jgi:hypothetical protein
MKQTWTGAVAAAFVSVFLMPCVCAAIGGVGGIGGVGAGAGRAGIGAIGGFPGAGPSNIFEPTNVMAPQRYRDLKVSGYFEIAGRKLAPEDRILRFRVNGKVIPMLLGPETTPAKLIFGPNDTYARRLFNAILHKEIIVIGDEFMRDRIVRAAAQKRLIEVEGYVFDPLSPYMILRSVEPAR